MEYSEITPRLLERAYWIYRRAGIVSSQTDFSQNILGRRPAYYSCMVTRSRRPGRRVLTQLREVTKTIMGTFLGNPHFGQPHAKNLNAAYADYETLIGLINEAIALWDPVDDTVADFGCA